MPREGALLRRYDERVQLKDGEKKKVADRFNENRDRDKQRLLDNPREGQLKGREEEQVKKDRPPVKRKIAEDKLRQKERREELRKKREIEEKRKNAEKARAAQAQARRRKKIETKRLQEPIHVYYETYERRDRLCSYPDKRRQC
jgi:colicin import membrane protein